VSYGTTEGCSLVLGRCSLALGRCSLVLGRCSLVLGRCSLVLGYCSLVLPSTHHFPTVVCKLGDFLSAPCLDRDLDEPKKFFEKFHSEWSVLPSVGSVQVPFSRSHRSFKRKFCTVAPPFIHGSSLKHCGSLLFDVEATFGAWRLERARAVRNRGGFWSENDADAFGPRSCVS
jgi:hypothetical protein